ncbi:MAG: hypothetical protein KF708_22500 [Pirellulales bacterium]|nr:hypothetical protein [Pirellulales bacterium]
MSVHQSAPSGNELSLDSWFRLISLEPALCELARRASRGGMPADWQRLTERLARFAGPSARRERPRGVRAYESASDYLRGVFERANAGGRRS